MTDRYVNNAYSPIFIETLIDSGVSILGFSSGSSDGWSLLLVLPYPQAFELAPGDSNSD